MISGLDVTIELFLYVSELVGVERIFRGRILLWKVSVGV